ncbi:MAG: beta-ketoacyl-[acyl-carrier-protein] synthase family protein [Chloroflexi bacterium]|nr:MAG: beta-ketoacyl-[acyl-carrier-protein] synthase family protein [Chloroflexota bacterium]MBL1193778.1 beta-ketoacyl-[acyl-carrier-protein] synthase family protein [Chloroflexota bacterium]NOH11071.1 beta-ketoacyl-[acyl-carrier-protein] synthase family protein [Chloroflexota bacterium]
MVQGAERVVITGLGVASPIGLSVADFWRGLLEGRPGISHLEEDIYRELKTYIGGVIKDFDGEEHYGRKDARRLSRSSQLALFAAEEAIEQSCMLKGDLDKDNVGVMIGSSIGGFAASDQYYRDFYLSRKFSPLVVPVSMNSGPSSNLSIRYGFRGPTFSVDAACATSNHSIGYAYNLIRFGQENMLITGGADSAFSPAVVASWSSMRALSERNDDPERALRPFSADRDGTVLGEAAAIFVVESESSAKKRDATILAEIVGYGATSDAYHITKPSLEGPSRAMQRALDDAGLIAEDIDYINAHATGTWANDSNEASAVKNVFGEHAYKIPVVGNKGAFGHSIAASGALELAGCVMSIKEQIVPKTLNYSEPDPACDLDFVPEGKREHRMKNVMNNSFAFGGSNASLILRAYEPA